MDAGESTYHAPTNLSMGHIHLKVSDLERAISFSRDVMGFDLLVNLGKTAFLSVGGYHHHIALNTWYSEGAALAPKESTGLFHFALNYPTRKVLAKAVKRLVEKDYPITVAYDHTTHQAVYISDPDSNGIEMAWDRDPSYWTVMTDGKLTAIKAQALDSKLDLDALLQEAE